MSGLRCVVEAKRNDATPMAYFRSVLASCHMQIDAFDPKFIVAMRPHIGHVLRSLG